MSEFVHFEIREGIAVIKMDDGKVNALGHEMFDALEKALDQAEEAGCPVVLTGREGRFSAGFDLKTMMSGRDAAVKLVTKGAEFYARLYTFPRPLVAACSGHALAGGALLLLAADERIGIDGPFKVGLNEVQIGIPLPHFGRELARERLHPQHLTRAAMGAHIYTPVEAIDAGFLDQVLAEEDLIETALRKAKHYGAFSSEAYAKTKAGLREATAQLIRDSIDEDILKMLPSTS